MEMGYTYLDIESEARGMLVDKPLGDKGRMLRKVCELAGRELESKLKKGVRAEEIRELFLMAAGMLALSLYFELLTAENEGLESFKAGNLSVKLKGDMKNPSAATLRSRAEGMLARYLEQGEFAFTGVAG